MTRPPLDQAIELMREAQRRLEGDHPVIAAHLETAIGLAIERGARPTEKARVAR